MKTHTFTLATAIALIAAGLFAPIVRPAAAQEPPKKEKSAKKEQRKDTGKSQEQHKDKSSKQK